VKSVPAGDAVAALLAKGFRKDPSARDHHMYFLWVGEKKHAFRVKISHGTKEIARGEIRMNANTYGISGDDLYKILCCEHDAARTLQVWNSRTKLRY
jgi:hypothetical protein